jgi:hypothetical protein
MIAVPGFRIRSQGVCRVDYVGQRLKAGILIIILARLAIRSRSHAYHPDCRFGKTNLLQLSNTSAHVTSTEHVATCFPLDDHHLDPGTHRSASLDDQTAGLCLAARRTPSGPAQAVQGPAEESIRPGEQG